VHCRALGDLGPVVESCVVSDLEPEACGAGIRLERDGEAGGGTPVLLQNAADPAVHDCRSMRFFERAMRAAERSNAVLIRH
jgi:hypothetical protein